MNRCPAALASAIVRIICDTIALMATTQLAWSSRWRTPMATITNGKTSTSKIIEVSIASAPASRGQRSPEKGEASVKNAGGKCADRQYSRPTHQCAILRRAAASKAIGTREIFGSVRKSADSALCPSHRRVRLRDSETLEKSWCCGEDGKPEKESYFAIATP